MTYTDHSLPAIGDVPPVTSILDEVLARVRGQPAVQPAPPAPPAPPASTGRAGLLNLFDADIAVPPPPIILPAAVPAQPVQNGKPGMRHHKAQTTVKLPPGMNLAAGARLEGRPGSPAAAALRPGQPTMQAVNDGSQFFDHPDVGGKFTIFALLYGPEQYFDLHQRCLNSIISTIPPGRGELRVGSNELNPRSCAFVDGLVEKGLVRKHYRSEQNIFKYPLMRQMTQDLSCPIETKWVIWFDDDSIADRNASWMAILCQAIIQHHRKDRAHCFGSKFVWTLQPGQKEWYESRPWWRGKPFRMHNGKESGGSGNKIIFATGGWWAMTHEAMIKCDIPDPELLNNGGDVQFGEALHQNGFEVKNFNASKQFIHTSSVDRRGASQPHPGTPAWHQLKLQLAETANV